MELARYSSDRAAFHNALLLEAAEDGDEELVRHLLEEEKASLRAKDSNGRNSLHLAVLRGHEHIASVLLEKVRIPKQLQIVERSPYILRPQQAIGLCHTFYYSALRVSNHLIRALSNQRSTVRSQMGTRKWQDFC